MMFEKAFPDIRGNLFLSAVVFFLYRSSSMLVSKNS